VKHLAIRKKRRGDREEHAFHLRFLNWPREWPKTLKRSVRPCAHKGDAGPRRSHSNCTAVVGTD
jgi:hypothetical protein